MKSAVKYILILLLPLQLFAGEVPEAVPDSLKKQKEFRYANDPSFWTTAKEDRDNNSLIIQLFDFFAHSPLARIIAYTILGLIILLVVYQIAVVNNFFPFQGEGVYCQSFLRPPPWNIMYMLF